jgi:hypothetical protein
MSSDIYGWVETLLAGEVWWDAAIRIRFIADRSYGMFASLFDVRNVGPAPGTKNFRAIAPGRGVPPNASEHFLAEYDPAGIGATWALWSELAAIDWEEEGQEYVTEEPPYHLYHEPGPGRRHVRRGDYLHGGWVTLFALMRVLAERFGADNVRLSVWFDE